MTTGSSTPGVGSSDVAAPHEPEADDTAALLACQTRVLALLSTNATLPVTLAPITAALEALIPTSSCSLLLLDEYGILRHGSAPSLPRPFLDRIDGLPPGPAAGSCGTAVYTGQPVVAADIAHDPRWVDYRDAALAAGLRACWSRPVFGRGERVVGTFAVYHPEVHEPTSRERHIVERLTHLASAVLEHAATVGALTVSEERFRRAFEDSALAMALLDTAGTVTSANEAMRTLAGVPLVGGSTALADIVAPDDTAGVTADVAEVGSGRRRQAEREVRVGPPQGERTAMLTMSLVRGASGEPYQISVTLADLTERLAARRERRARLDAEIARRSAEAASRAKSAFLSAVSHEMRTPLQAITGFTELLGTMPLDAARRAEALEHIAAGAAHLLELVDDTLDLSRIEANALPLTMTVLPVAPVVDEVLQFLAPVAARHGVSLDTDTCHGEALADHRRLRQVLINLVSNGIRYSGQHGAVRVGASGTATATRITVTDNGPGIDPALRARLFEPFVHGAPGRAPHGEQSGEQSGEPDEITGGGVGLGLMLARGLTEAMGGRLTIDDAPGGRGTVATIELRPS